uniref:Clathrin/coatomer adaptor adaptin-like N-terminal domain-containing protein n=1 Tax=Vitis vinifera TaxID=29760 RepID=F6H2R6_VITVI
MPTTERDSSNSFVIACHDAGLGLAHEKHHGKIIRGNALRIAFTVYGRQEEADILIEQMTRDQDPILRYGDVSDDVRRIVVLAIGFVLYSEPEQTPRIVSLLSESYNPHIRYGAAIAIKISYVNTVLSEVIPLLEPLTSDGVDFVHQGALIAMAKVMVKINASSDSRVGTFKQQLEKIILDKHEDV